MTDRLQYLIGNLSSRSEELSRANRSLEQHSMEIGLLAEMSNLLRSCSATDEAYRVISTFASRILPADAGKEQGRDRVFALEENRG